MRVRLSVLTAAVAAGAALAPAPAVASGPGNGVHVDPNSPAGKQYEIPIPSARQEASGGSHHGSGGSAPLFGVGVTAPHSSTASATTSAPPPTTTTTSAPATASSTKPHRVSHTRRHHHPRASIHNSAVQPQSQTTRSESIAPATQAAYNAGQVGSSGWLPLVAGGALVLVVGGGLGAGIRRRNARHQ